MGCGETLPALTDYTQNGPFATTTIANTGPDGGYTAVQPTTLGQNGFKHPVATWGNGITTTPSIYPTLLKQMPWAPQGLARLTEWKRHLRDIPLVAIGGLTLERLAGVFAAGADSAAVVTDIVRHPKPEQRMGAWLAAASQELAVAQTSLP